ncbi:tetratricopeptide repeat protein 21B [Exaiptasia diaphana]|uniref:Tetratricopeptide repeat protein 21B n=2 Tax=Exaiptasia diaphana TaxID=2652724 RepID=A0A913XIR2_EXADI|nr:tetratricopeptide repeat protein 21B [Exaiptasia diaphana]KXJ11499.1 Tetratricopeptide repeat protein 21B [Exaiptasia diaphana]
MASNDSFSLALINYYCREKYYRHLQNTCLESLQKYGNDPVLIFWKAFGILMEDRASEAMRELELIKDKPEVLLCTSMALIYAHKKAKLVDREAVQDLESKLRQDRQNCGEMALYFGSMFLWHSGKVDKSREYVDRMIKMSPNNKAGLILRGWIDLSCGREAFVKKSIKFFDEALSGPENVKNLDGLLGKAHYLQSKNNFSGALEAINQAIVAYPECVPALVEKMTLQLALQDWDQACETAQRALAINRNCIEAKRIVLLYLLCREGNYNEVSDKVVELIQIIDRCEPRNPALYHDISRGISRLCGRNNLVLQQTHTMMERAKSLSPNNAEFLIEIGNQLIFQVHIKEATKTFRTAMKLDETSVPALTGIIKCQLIDGQIEDAEQQLEFLNEIQQSIGKSAELSYLTSVLYRKKGKPQQDVMNALNDAIDTHFTGLQGLALGVQYFYQMNPDFLLQIIGDYLKYAPSEPQTAGQPVPPLLKRCAAVLDPLTKTVPGLLNAQYLMAKVKYLAGEVDSAKSMLSHCLEQDSTFSDAHLLMAQIHLQKANYQQANQSLEVGLSYNFEVREHPSYHLIKAQVQQKMGNPEESIKTLMAAMNLPGVQKAASKSNKKSKIQIQLSDRVSVYLGLVEAHRQAGNMHESAKFMQDAINEFHGTSEEVRVQICNVDLALERGDTEQALSILRAITPEQPYYIKAKEKMAEIYLHHRKDKRLYASVYRELVDKNPSPHTCLLLGDAYMSIQEPEKAIEVYESAIKRNPRDGALASKIGQAYVKTHHYGKAINYYEAALKTGQQNFLRYDLAELYLKLRSLDKAEKVIKAALEQEKASDLPSLMAEARLLALLAQVYQKSNSMEQTLNTLIQAKDLQTRVLKRVAVEQPDAVQAQKLLAAKICSEMAELSTTSREYDKAIKYYKEALAYDDTHKASMLALAKLYLTVDDLDACQQQCVSLLKMDPGNDSATVMMADLMFRKNEYDSATYHFQQLLDRKPGHYAALARLIDLLRRAGKLDECPKYIEQAEKSVPRAAMDSGLNYCKGLYEWYTLNPTGALKHFNLSRKDSDWGETAVYNMVEICLNPDNETLGGETFEAMDMESSPSEKQDSEIMAVRTAERLLKELKPKANPLKYRILENCVLLATKAKPSVELALAQFMEIATTERDYVPALLGMATAYMYLKQTPRARNQLKRIAKMNWTSEDAEEFERSWLLLADIYIQSGKYDMASDLLKKCIQYNKSCCKAWEYMGFIMEKEQAYKDAAKNYENAWKNGNRNNPTIGFRLAFNYLKAKRYVDAIDVCHLVLNQHPHYPKIKKEILDKARSLIRI